MTHLPSALKRLLVVSLVACSLTTPLWAGTKDIVLDIVGAPASRTLVTEPVAPARDALAVSMLLESGDGSLRATSTQRLFHTGERFRVKLTASRPAMVVFYNTNPRGEFNPQPVWQGRVAPGVETVSPRLRLDGNSGIDQLHIVMLPASGPDASTWLARWLQHSAPLQPASKDIVLDVEHAEAGTYLLNQGGQGAATTVRITHQ